MAHFAEVNKNNFVTRVLVVHDSQEHRGQDFLANDLGLDGRWIQTSYSGRIRGTFAGIGSVYVEEKDEFSIPQPYPSWKLNLNDVTWYPPVPYPTNNKQYCWNEKELTWEEVK